MSTSVRFSVRCFSTNKLADYKTYVKIKEISFGIFWALYEGRVAPFGLFGGEDGLPHDYKIISNGTDRPLGSKETEVMVNPGDHVYCLSSGGGGYGNPADRSPEAEEWDRRNGYVG